jgi:large-conductance mechanosensitive channel
MKKLLPILSVILLLNSFGYAQNAAQPELESGTIESQFDYIITKSSTFKEFQLIRKTSILKVKKNALDSLNNLSSQYGTIKASVAPLQSEIKTLEGEIVNLKAEVETTAQDKDSITFLGKKLNKASYNTFVWSLVVILIVALAFFILQFKNSHAVTKKAKNNIDKVEEELEEFKKKAMKKEQELMRKLQDELNKNS